jgi:cysteine desulfurase
MLPCHESVYANPSAIHRAGQDAKKLLEAARRRVADCVGAMPSEIFFTSGGTESDNWAIMSAAAAVETGLSGGGRGRHMVTSSFEHNAVLKPMETLASRGWECTLVSPGKDGIVDPEEVASAVRPDTVLVSVMAVNNVAGTVQPVKEMAAAAHAKGAIFHTDAVQAAGHIPVDARGWNVDLMSISAHKFHGPKGTGVLFAKIPRLPIPLIDGGGQERGGRSGTENVPGAVGMAEALAESVERLDEDSVALSALRDRLIERVLRIEGAVLVGHPTKRLPGNACFAFRGLDGLANIVAGLDEAGIEASSGSACSASSKEADHVLVAMGHLDIGLRHSLRISLSRWNTPSDIERIADRLDELIPILKIHRSRH